MIYCVYSEIVDTCFVQNSHFLSNLFFHLNMASEGRQEINEFNLLNSFIHFPTKRIIHRCCKIFERNSKKFHFLEFN